MVETVIREYIALVIIGVIYVILIYNAIIKPIRALRIAVVVTAILLAIIMLINIITLLKMQMECTEILIALYAAFEFAGLYLWKKN